MKTLKWMTKNYNSILLSIIGILLGIIVWGGKTFYYEIRESNAIMLNQIQDINTKQVIFEYRLTSLEKTE